MLMLVSTHCMLFSHTVEPVIEVEEVILVEMGECDLTLGESVYIIFQATSQTGQPFFLGLFRFFFGVNTIECIPGGFRVSLQEVEPGHGFIIIDIIDDL